ncbi:hypothetical protein V1358_08040 [Pseudoalteromonas sp. YIC-656]|uniref:hypothetical protein n=1 Tax=Pseudoalteromonas pernae TaxID=3118054 RepID=UPI003242FFA2
MNMRHLIYVAPMCLALSATANTQSNIAAKTLSATISQSAITLETAQHFDTYLVTITGKDGFTTSFESNSPYIDVSSVSLPYDGEFNYEVKAIEFLGEVQEQSYLNNGRGADAKRKLTRVEVINGSFNSQHNTLQRFDNVKEQSANASNQW